jgi:hypothetical protein
MESDQSIGWSINCERVASVDVCVARGVRVVRLCTRVCLDAPLLHGRRRERNSKEKRTFSGVRLTGPIVKSFQTNSPKKLLPHLIPSLSSSLLLCSRARACLLARQVFFPWHFSDGTDSVERSRSLHQQK